MRLVMPLSQFCQLLRQAREMDSQFSWLQSVNCYLGKLGKIDNENVELILKERKE